MVDFGKKKNQVKDEFVFDEDGDLPFEEEDEYAEFAPSLMKGGGRGGRSGGGSSASRTIVLLLVLVALGGAAYYYLVMSPASSPAPAASAPQRKPVVVTPKPAGAPQSATAPASATPTKPAVVPPVTATPASSPPASTTKATPTAAPTPTVKAVPAPDAAKPVLATPAAPAAAKPAAAPVAAATSVPAVQEPKPVIEPESAPPVVAEGGYTLLGGSFVTKAGLHDAERKARRLGYTPMIKEIRRPVTMIRLRIGYFSPAEAEAKRKALSRQISGVFTLKEGDQVALYAASHYNLDKARSYADKLFQQGISVEEEQVEVVMPLKQLRYGVFASHSAAEKAGKQARKLGLEAVVVKR